MLEGGADERFPSTKHIIHAVNFEFVAIRSVKNTNIKYIPYADFRSSAFDLRYVVHRPGRDGVEININRFPSAWSRLRFRPQVPRSCRLTRLPAPDRTSCQ